MRYFFVDTLGDLEDPRLCILDKTPDRLGVKYSRLVDGRPVASEVPPGTTMRMSPDRTGLRLATLIGNTQSFLILHRDAKEVVAAENARRGGRSVIEYIPFVLLDHKGRPHSDDYFLVNPIGPIDCLDPQLSVIRYWRNTEKVLGIDRFVLDPAKLQDAPPIFRIREAPDEYVIDEALAQAIQAKGFTNLNLAEVEVKGAAKS